VAYPGKGTGTGFHLLGPDTVYDLNGVNIPAGDGSDAQFKVKDSNKLQAFLATHPDRVATKHAHSELNPERMWGNFALKSIRFTLWALNHRFMGQNLPEFTKKNTIVIASGVSNGAGTTVRALEKDTSGLIDGLVVSEPSMNPRAGGRVTIEFGNDTFASRGLTLYDNITVMGTYAGCAALDDSLAGTPLFGAQPIGAPANALQNRCAALRQLGLLSTNTLQQQAAESLAMLRAIGYYEEEDWGIASHEWLNLWRSLQPTYAAAQGQFPVWQNICDVSFGATDTDGLPIPVPAATAASLFATSSGIPATSGINLIADNAANGPINEQLAISKRTGLQDLNLDGALCFRFLSTGDSRLLGRPSGGKDLLMHRQFHQGGRDTQTTGYLRHIPSIIIHGRQDALVFPNSQSRAYFGLNQSAESGKSQLSYWEVTPAQHFDAFISSYWRVPLFAGPVMFVPLHYYLTEGLEMMMAHLTNGAPLPPSQVIRATARGTDPIDPAQLPLPVLNPGADAITYSNGVVHIPK
jgi:hydroxybutyrate-dimer hydrolase